MNVRAILSIKRNSHYYERVCIIRNKNYHKIKYQTFLLLNRTSKRHKSLFTQKFILIRLDPISSVNFQLILRPVNSNFYRLIYYTTLAIS